MQFYAARGAGLPFIAMLQPRMAAATSALQVLRIEAQQRAQSTSCTLTTASHSSLESSIVAEQHVNVHATDWVCMQARLSEGLAAALAARSASAVGHALHAYSSIGDAEGAQVCHVPHHTSKHNQGLHDEAWQK